jgi:hypothetical protein
MVDKPEALRYASRRDSTMVGLLWLTMAGMLAIMVAILYAEVPAVVRFVGMVGAVGALIIPGAILWRTDYRLAHDALLVRSGIFRWRVPYRDITGIERRRSLLSAPALSVQRLRIRYKGAPLPLEISPQDMDGFQEELARRTGIGKAPD